MEACKTYCEDPSHMEECMSFALENGFVTEEEASRARNLRQTLMETSGPGGCEGAECRTYCDDVSHHEDCKKFAEEHGFGRPDEGDRRPEGMDEESEREGRRDRPCNTKEECEKMFESGGRPEYQGGQPPYDMDDGRSREQEGEYREGSGMEYRRQYEQDSERRYEENRGEYPQPPSGSPDGQNYQPAPEEVQYRQIEGMDTEQYPRTEQAMPGEMSPPPPPMVAPENLDSSVWRAFRNLGR